MRRRAAFHAVFKFVIVRIHRETRAHGIEGQEMM